MADVIIINEADNVAVVMRDVAAGRAIELPGGESLTALADLPAGHKVAITAIGEGGAIVKYGESIGEAAEDIAAGDWVHTHNIKPAK
ncbi:MAG TPA: UxaA family hydrolase [Candidatus Anoxymicrobiaceae bacterium]|jgi:altronate hydrolase